MGMFTSVMHQGRELQIKTGFDQCAVYRLYDKVDWQPDPYYPGDGVDGIHESYTSSGRGPYVVIQSGIITAIEDGEYEDLRAKYIIVKPDPALWTPEQWADAEARRKRYDAEYEAYAAKHGGSPAEVACSFYIHMKLREPSVINQLLPTRKVDP